MQIRLVCIDGEAIPDQIDLESALEFGRDPHCDVRLLGTAASRYHCMLRYHKGQIVLEDHRSRNGTWVKGQRIKRPTLLEDGMRFSAGDASFVVLCDTQEDAPSRVVADGGLTLRSSAQMALRPWQGGDDSQDLAGLHLLSRHLAERSSQRARAGLLCEYAQRLLGAQRSALVCQGTKLAGSCSPRLALRLAAGRQARLLSLGKELQGQTIAAESVGSALSAPLALDTWLIVLRGLEDEPFVASDLAAIARLAAEAQPYLSDSQEQEAFARLVGKSPVMQQLRQRLQRLARVDSTVLISGESGTGKELIAQALHAASGRRSGPFIALNCAAVSPSLFEAELFGHARGAFTGADRARPGRIRAADGGTLFLDEIGELPLELQAKLLRVLQEGQVEPLGEHQSQSVDIRVLAATNRDLASRVSEGTFREDLFYRLDVLRVQTPPLRERGDDIVLLAQHLLARLAEEQGRPPPQLAPDTCQRLCAYAWPGNVRQLANSLERAMVLCDHQITADDLELEACRRGPQLHYTEGAGFPSLAQVEAQHVAAALARSQGNKSAAARMLGISRPTLLRKIDEYGLS